MKLISQRDIALEQAKQKRIEIEEGVKIASRVDKLRLTLSEEEIRFNQFKEQSKKILEEEIAPLASKKNSLLREIQGFKEEIKLVDSLLENKWKKALEKDNTFKELKEKLKQREDQLKLIEVSLSERDSKIFQEEKRVKDIIQDSVTKNSKISELHNKAEQLKKETENLKKEAEEERKTARQEILAQKAELAVKERELKIKDKSLERSMKEIEEEKIRLSDQRATLARAFKRLNLTQ